MSNATPHRTRTWLILTTLIIVLGAIVIGLLHKRYVKRQAALATRFAQEVPTPQPERHPLLAAQTSASHTAASAPTQAALASSANIDPTNSAAQAEPADQATKTAPSAQSTPQGASTAASSTASPTASSTKDTQNDTQNNAQMASASEPSQVQRPILKAQDGVLSYRVDIPQLDRQAALGTPVRVKYVVQYQLPDGERGFKVVGRTDATVQRILRLEGQWPYPADATNVKLRIAIKADGRFLYDAIYTMTD